MSNSTAGAFAGNLNTGDQSNGQSQDAEQSGGNGGWYGKKDDGDAKRIEQTQTASNTIDQDANARAKSFNLAPNVALGNWGDTRQSSSSEAGAFAGNLNTGDQSNCQSQQANQGGAVCHRVW